jgi:N4-(beta-N-acetylglucosaminyl)-L-asparaginase
MPMLSRRSFLNNTLAASLLASLEAKASVLRNPSKAIKPIVISTWNFGVAANAEAWKVLSTGGKSLDAVEAGVKISEADPKVTSVGYGGLPDRDGRVTLDACIMNEHSACGAVACMEHIMHPISVARLVMEKTPHVFLVGEGALAFAIENGFQKTNLLTPESEAAWKKWLEQNKYTPKTDYHNHDTIGMLALDEAGNISGACTTSGRAYKMHGRVGDSPIIGAGLFVDNEVGGATSTGVGEEVIRICGSHTVVEYMRQGYSPYKACKATVERMMKKSPTKKEDISVGFLALNKKGEYGAYAVKKGYQIAVHSAQEAGVLKDIDFGG